MNSSNTNIIPPLPNFNGHDTLLLHGKTCSAIDEQTENGSRKNSTYNSLECEVEKKDQR